MRGMETLPTCRDIEEWDMVCPSKQNMDKAIATCLWPRRAVDRSKALTLQWKRKLLDKVIATVIFPLGIIFTGAYAPPTIMTGKTV